MKEVLNLKNNEKFREIMQPENELCSLAKSIWSCSFADNGMSVKSITEDEIATLINIGFEVYKDKTKSYNNRISYVIAWGPIDIDTFAGNYELIRL